MNDSQKFDSLFRELNEVERASTQKEKTYRQLMLRISKQKKYYYQPQFFVSIATVLLLSITAVLVLIVLEKTKHIASIQENPNSITAAMNNKNYLAIFPDEVELNFQQQWTYYQLNDREWNPFTKEKNKGELQQTIDFGEINNENIMVELYKAKNIDSIVGYINFRDDLIPLGTVESVENSQQIKTSIIEEKYEASNYYLNILGSIGSRESGYHYLIYNSYFDQLMWTHNYGYPTTIDVDIDGAMEIVMQEEDTNGNPKELHMLRWDGTRFDITENIAEQILGEENLQVPSNFYIKFVNNTIEIMYGRLGERAKVATYQFDDVDKLVKMKEVILK